MTWTAPRTWVTGEVVTAAMMNVDVKQNISHLGGMLRNGVALSAMSSPSEILGNYGAKAHHTTTIAVSNTTWTNILFDTEGASGWDSGTIHSVSSNTQNFTVPVSGMYYCAVEVGWASNATGVRILRILQDGTQIAEDYEPTVPAALFTQQCSWVANCAAGSVISFQAWQNSGVSINLTNSSTYGIAGLVQYLGARIV